MVSVAEFLAETSIFYRGSISIVHDLRFRKYSVTTHKSQRFQIIWRLWRMMLLNFYRNLRFSIGDSISIGWHRNNIHFQNISRSAAQMYQSLTASFGFVEFLSNFYRECNFYRGNVISIGNVISKHLTRTIRSEISVLSLTLSDVPAFENISVEWYCWISIGTSNFYRKFKFWFWSKMFKENNFYRM